MLKSYEHCCVASRAERHAEVGGIIHDHFLHTVLIRPENASDTTMDILKLICLTIIQMVKQVWSLPQTVANAIKQRRRQVVLDEHEVERLDRIRNPSKYLGK